ncbi:MAG: nickel pincer cofactor biosynthesis protein LarC [Eubacteriales bacterium]|nr:nickel pincer cofactor biosynthesis protein LarC [Eubacteriales bacterium]
MKILYLDLGMGAAGDMLTAALLELFPEGERAGVVEKLNGLGIPDVTYKAEPSVKCGITGTHMTVMVGDAEEDEHMHEHHHHHEHGHEHAHGGHTHVHNSMTGISHVVNDHTTLSEKVKKDVLAVYDLIAEAEGHVHGKPVTEIHFHEVGTMDAVADVSAVSLLIDMLSPDKIVVSPVNTGSGQVKCAHGIMPVPAPATAYLLNGIPSYDSGIKGELLTPTGAALIKHFADSFGSRPAMSMDRVGYGMGKKDFEAANCVRAILGESMDPETSDYTGTVVELAANLDDMTAEEIGFAFEKLLEAGAVDVWTEAAVMKKNRPGNVLKVLVREDKKDELVTAIFKYTSTIGIREAVMKRYTLKREIVEKDTAYGRVRVKKTSGYGVERSKFEYEDIAEIARKNGMSIAEARKAAAHS